MKYQITQNNPKNERIGGVMNLQWLKEKGACSEGMAWYEKNGDEDVFKTLAKLKKVKQYQWANWLLSKTFTKPQAVEYAIFAAEQVIGIFEKKYPNDKRPRKAIEAAKTWLKEPTEANRQAAANTAAAAYAAAYADSNTAAAADAAANAAYANAAYANAAAKEKMQVKIINQGIKILKKGLVE
jgi:hypothetical protein